MSLNAPRYFSKLACLVKPEATYATDSTPAAADRIIMSNVTFRPLASQRISRDLLLPYLGNQGVMLSGFYATIEGDIEIAGSGTPGTPPLWGTMARIAGMAETVTADTMVEYERADNPHDSGSIYFVMDGIRHILIGARANLSFTLSATANQTPRMRASVTGLLGTISTQPNPVVSRTGWLTPVPVNKANTTLELFTETCIAESLTVDLGNTVTPMFMIGDEAVIITAQSATGTAIVQAVALSEVNWFDIAKQRTQGALDFQHGTVAGNIFEIAATAVEIGEPTPGQWNNILNYSLPLDLCVTSGFDDVKITVR